MSVVHSKLRSLYEDFCTSSGSENGSTSLHFRKHVAQVRDLGN